MSTPIETNTEELRGILEDVYNLPARNGGSQPDLVIKVVAPQGSSIDTDGDDEGETEALNWYSIESGNVADVVQKLRNFEETKIVIKMDYHYFSYKYTGYANCLSAIYDNYENLLSVCFMVPYSGTHTTRVYIALGIRLDGTFDRVRTAWLND